MRERISRILYLMGICEDQMRSNLRKPLARRAKQVGSLLRNLLLQFEGVRRSIMEFYGLSK